VPAGVLTVVCAVFYGLIRFRAPFEVCMAVLAAAPLVLLAERLRRPRRAPEGVMRDPDAAPLRAS
jgi:hypothetical protein